jgi:hypothetical protein
MKLLVMKQPRELCLHAITNPSNGCRFLLVLFLDMNQEGAGGPSQWVVPEYKFKHVSAEQPRCAHNAYTIFT